MTIKLKRLFKILALLIAILMVSTPFAIFAQQNSLQAEAIAAAERDAQNNVNESRWFLSGCFGGPPGCYGFGSPAGTDSAVPPLPAARLLGKSPEYIAFYAKAYSKKAKELQTRSATAGCISGVGVIALLILIGVIGAQESSSEEYYYSY